MKDRLGFWRRAGTVALVLALGWLIVHFGRALPELGAGGILVDFDAFYIAGQLVREGRAEAAYDLAEMARIQHAIVGHEGFMPWTYPPPYDLIVSLLPGLPRWAAFVAFVLPGFGLYVYVLARLAGPQTWAVLLALLPPIYVTATIGQNAFWVAGLMGLYALGARHRRAWSGLALGLLVVKPHLGVTLGLHALVTRGWAALAWAFGVALGLCALATLVLGPAIWTAFLGAVGQAGQALATGFYPLFRMSSAYALAHTLGASPALASAVQGASALAALAVTGWAAGRLPPRRALAVACFSAVLISPYVYDYDMALVGIALALVARDIAQRTGWAERGLVLIVAWVAGGWGMVQAISTAGMTWEARAEAAQATVAFGAVAYLVLLALVARILSRPAR